jgi:GSCFA family
MNLRTELSLKYEGKIDLKDPVLTLGSCFAQSIGQKFADNKFQVSINPFGSTYHPLSIHKLLLYTALHEVPQENTFLKNNGVYLNYDFHSMFNGVSEVGLQKILSEVIGSLHYQLKNCKVLILTYGTSWIYERVDTGEAVANCHKMPSGLFIKRLTSTDEIKESFRRVYETLLSNNPSIRVILTVSPVRHLKDTLELNNVSKSVLRVACHQLSEEFSEVSYFPAYEIMIDDLRDYRFYKDDLIHPTDMAEEYIWQKFSATLFNQKTLNFLREWQEINKALAHRPFHPSGNSHKKFVQDTIARLEELKSQVDVEREIINMKSQLG